MNKISELTDSILYAVGKIKEILEDGNFFGALVSWKGLTVGRLLGATKRYFQRFSDDISRLLQQASY